MATTTRTARKSAAKRSTPSKKAAAPTAAAGKPKAKPAKPAAKGSGAAPKAAKAKKPKLVRDSFTIPKAEYAVLEELKARAARLGRPAKKSEVLRAGVQALAAMADAAFMATVGKLGPAKAAAKA